MNRNYICFPVSIPCQRPVSSLLQLNNSYFVLTSAGDCVTSISREGMIQGTFKTARPYHKMTYDRVNNCFWATTLRAGRTLCKLDTNFLECDAVTIPVSASSADPILCACADESCNILYVITPLKVFCVNTNGDYIKSFLTPRVAGKLTAISVCAEYVFIGYRKSGCDYLMKYRKDGGYVESYCFGEDCQIHTVQQVFIDEQCRLSIAVNRQDKYPHIILLPACAPPCDCLLKSGTQTTMPVSAFSS